MVDTDTDNLHQNYQHDFHLLQECLKYVDYTDNLSCCNLRRIGKFIVNKCRPLCVTLPSRQDLFKILNKSKSFPRGITVSSDKTRLQQNTFKFLKAIQLEHNSKYPNDQLHIKFIDNIPNLLDANNDLRNPKNSLMKLNQLGTG